MRIRIGVIVLVSITAAIAVAQNPVIDFEDQPAGTPIIAEYGNRGVIFAKAFLDSDPHAHSGTKVLRAASAAVEHFTPEPLVMTFPTAAKRVAFFAGNYTGVTGNGTLRAFDANNALVARDGPKPVPNNAFTAFFEVRSSAGRIARAEFLIEGSALASIDDLVVEGSVGTLPTTPPSVVITNPADGVILAEGTTVLRGTVAGESLVDPITLQMKQGLPPDSTAPPAEYPVSLSGSGTSRTFSLDYSPIVGSYTLTAIATNTANLRGTASVRFDVLPPAIERRYGEDGGAAVFGALRFGSSDADCVVAVFEKGLIATNSNNVFVVKGAFLTKWMATREAGGPMSRLGCPSTEERDVQPGARAQDFQHARIYATASSTAYVPGVFAKVIDDLGGESTVGIPTTDPTSDSHPQFRTWLLQRFAREGIPVASTLEIRGDPPRLFVERQGGHLKVFEGVVRANNPVIVESFDCASTTGPCFVVPPPDEPLFSGATVLCHGLEFNFATGIENILVPFVNVDPPEWVPVRGDLIPAPIWGVLFEAKHAKGDNPFTHRQWNQPCPADAKEALISWVLALGPAAYYIVEGLRSETICASDWDLKIRPLPGFRSMQAVNRDAVQIEFERKDWDPYAAAYDILTPGQLIFSAGRLVVDCGHGGPNKDSFKTEIHPPFVYASVSMVTRNGRPATQADIWVTKFFPGGDAPENAVEFDIFPPPRPAPQAVLGASTPGDQNAAVKVTFKPLGPFGPMRVRVTATRGTPEVTKYGEMKPRNETVPFGFDGRLHVFWNCPAGTTCQ